MLCVHELPRLRHHFLLHASNPHVCHVYELARVALGAVFQLLHVLGRIQARVVCLAVEGTVGRGHTAWTDQVALLVPALLLVKKVGRPLSFGVWWGFLSLLLFDEGLLLLSL